MIHILYHANCTDGFCSAYLFRLHYPDANFIPVKYGEPFPDIDKNDEIYIVDFSYPRDVLLELTNCIVLDHHKTAEAELAGIDFCTFDMNRSGAKMCYDFLEFDDPVLCEYVDYIQDRDLWKWELPNSKEINTAIRCYPQDFEAWDDMIATPIDKLIDRGAAINQYRQMIIDQHLEFAEEVELGGHKGLAVLCTVPELWSEIGGALAEKAEFGACYVNNTWSLRSKTVDVSEIAKKFGGGGHKNAAGFKKC